MSDMQIISEAPINASQLRKELEKIKSGDKELNLRSNRTLDYLNQVTSGKDTDELFQNLMKLNIPRLKEQHINKIIDIAPTTANQLKYVVQSYTLTLTNESINKIVETMNEFFSK